jgi:Zn-dependent protease
MLLFALVAHEFAHGWTALHQGDDTAYKLGRLTLNPIPHIDPIMTIGMPALLWFLSGGRFTFGGAKPVPVITRNFRNYVRGDLIVSSAGIITNLIIAVGSGLLFVLAGWVHATVGGVGTSMVDTGQRMLVWSIHLNLILASFNLIPIPPLDGSRLFYHALPATWGARFRSMERFGFLPLMALMFFFPRLLELLLTPAFMGEQGILRLALPFAVGDGWNIFSR